MFLPFARSDWKWQNDGVHWHSKWIDFKPFPMNSMAEINKCSRFVKCKYCASFPFNRNGTTINRKWVQRYYIVELWYNRRERCATVSLTRNDRYADWTEREKQRNLKKIKTKRHSNWKPYFKSSWNQYFWCTIEHSDIDICRESFVCSLSWTAEM